MTDFVHLQDKRQKQVKTKKRNALIIRLEYNYLKSTTTYESDSLHCGLMFVIQDNKNYYHG